MWMLGLGLVIGSALGRWSATLRQGDRSAARALLALQYELVAEMRDGGRAALDAHANDWKASPIFRRYPSIAEDAVIREYLVEALRLLADDPEAGELDRQLSAALRTARKRSGTARGAGKRDRVLDSIRRNVLQMRRTAAPSSRIALDDKASTQDITRAKVELALVARR